MDPRKVSRFVNNNLVLIVGIPLIIGIHWGWSKLQEVPALVPEKDRKGIPIVEGANYLGHKLAEEVSFLKQKVLKRSSTDDEK